MKEIDLSEILNTSERPTLKFDEDHTYEVRNDKFVIFKLNEIRKNNKIPDFAESGDKYDEIIKLTLGEKALEYINSKRFSVDQLRGIMNGIMAQVTERPIEEIEREEKEEEERALKEQSFRK